MSSQTIKTYQLDPPWSENSRIYFAIVTGGMVMLLMILAEMKFFGT